MAHAAVEGLEVAAAFAELADATMGALERRKNSSKAAIRERQIDQEFHVHAEAEISKERAENERLRNTLHMYEEALASFEKQGLLEHMEQLNGLSPDQLCNKLKKTVDSPQFLRKLEASTHGGAPVPWIVVEEPEDDEDDFVIVSQEDVIDSIASYMANYLASHPNGKNMTPEQLQKAMSKAFTVKESSGFFKMIWHTGKVLYTVGSWTATVVGIYRNPFLVRAAIMACWTTVRVLSRLVA